MGSANYVNYSIRPNKTVERKLVFRILTLLDPIYSFNKYRYIGLGALWFVDFVLAHKQLSIMDMISIEKDEFIASRAEFNKPYSCVKIEAGESNMILPGLSLEEKPLLVWLDYDTSIDGPVLGDLATLCQRAPTGSVVIVTINARKKSLPNQDADGKEFPNDEERLRYVAGDLIPQNLPKTIQTSKYPCFLATLIFNHMRHHVRVAGRQNELIFPLFNIAYKDNAQMLTVGAIVTDGQSSQETSIALETGNVNMSMDEKIQISINVPPLTLKEKATLDQLMPCDSAPTENEISNLGFRLKPSQIEAYHRFYRDYPMFGEVTI